MTTATMQEKNLEKQIEKQMGCMAGFLQLFDRHHIISGKKFYTTKRLTSATVIDAASGSETSTVASPDISRELAKPQTPKKLGQSPSHAVELRSDEMLPPKSPLPLPIFNLKEGSTKSSTWKFKETPRLSLDSRATYDAAKGSLHRKEIRADRQILPPNPAGYAVVAGDAGGCDGDGDDNDKQRGRSSTSVIARLMGLEPVSQPDSEPVKPAELRRSASESRVTRDLFHYRFIEANNNSHSKQPNQSLRNDVASESTIRKSGSDVAKSKAMNKGGLVNSLSSSSPSTWKSPQHGRSWFEAAEVFPETRKQTASVYGEIEKRLKKMSGIDESASKDLETLKQILEAWQLKGLLHSRRQNSEQLNHPNFVFDRSFPFDESPIVVMKPSRSQIHRIDDDSPSFTRGGTRRNLNLPGNSTPPPPPRDRNVRSPTRSRSPSDGNARRSNSIVKPKPVSNVETQRRVNESTESRRATSSVHSPRVNQRKIGSDPTVTNRSSKNKKPTAEIYHKEKITTVITEDESSSVSGSSVSTSSQTDAERSKMVEYKEGRSLLERCDKLLHSIAEMNATDQQSSPVSVLDSSFYELASPSPIMKRNIDFKDNSGELEEETWSREILSIADAPDDYELAYISEILRASHFLPEDSDIFSFLEKQQYLKGKDTSKISRLQRKLIFDTITEILDRDKLLPPWKVLSWKDSTSIKPSLQKIWLEFQKIRERDNADELLDIICGVLKKDLASDTINGWGECPVELSDTVLDIERMIFRDLVGETIRDLAIFASQTTILVAPRRKLVF